VLAVLKAENVGLAYESGLIFKKRLLVLQGISLEMEEGKTLGLMGVSGSGKTTLGKILAGLERPSSGRVVFGEEDIWRLRGREFLAFRRQVQMLFQDPEGSLNPRKSIERSIHEVLSLQKIPQREWRERTREIFEMVGLSEELLCRYPAQISGGQCQRVALGRVLLLHPKVMILDEATSALDISVQSQILNLLEDLQRDLGLAYLLISHQPEVIRFMAHETIHLVGGNIQTKER
jgi:peptide/nickel transport system ATP-binding protein